MTDHGNFPAIQAEVTSRILWLRHPRQVEPDILSDITASLTSLHPNEEPLVRAFASNVRALLATASVPYRMAFASVYGRRLQALTAAERIRRIPLDESEETPERLMSIDREAAQAGHDQLRALMARDEDRRAVAREVATELHSHLQSPDFASAAEELLRQCTTLAWSALETLVKDLYRVRFLRAPQTLGSALARLLTATTPHREIMESLGVWGLYQQRHLIVHRAGIVDQKFSTLAGRSEPVGTRLLIRPSELEAHAASIVRTATKLVQGS